jgi:hypothetical protein
MFYLGREACAVTWISKANVKKYVEHNLLRICFLY